MREALVDQARERRMSVPSALATYRALTARQIDEATRAGLACSQYRNTCQPRARKSASVSRSRRTLPSIFSRHQLALVRGQVMCFGHPCQKHPSMNTATRARMKAMSALRRVPGTGQSTRYRSPLWWTAERTISSQAVSRRGVACIRRLVSGVGGSGVFFTLVVRYEV